MLFSNFDAGYDPGLGIVADTPQPREKRGEEYERIARPRPRRGTPQNKKSRYE